jgi:hypothetical protein
MRSVLYGQAARQDVAQVNAIGRFVTPEEIAREVSARG